MLDKHIVDVNLDIVGTGEVMCCGLWPHCNKGVLKHEVIGKYEGLQVFETVPWCQQHILKHTWLFVVINFTTAWKAPALMNSCGPATVWKASNCCSFFLVRHPCLASPFSTSMILQVSLGIAQWLTGMWTISLFSSYRSKCWQRCKQHEVFPPLWNTLHFPCNLMNCSSSLVGKGKYTSHLNMSLQLTCRYCTSSQLLLCTYH